MPFIIRPLRSLKHGFLKTALRVQVNDLQLLIYDVEDSKERMQAEGFSQHGQDVFCFRTVFNFAKNGVFVDVGANHPTKFNNTYYFEKYGWSGIAFEPQEHLRKLWDGERTTKCLPYVIGKENKIVDFVETNLPGYHVYAGVEGANKLGGAVPKTTVKATQRRLDEVLLEHQIRRVDYLSVDVEGYEMDVLQGLDFSKIPVRCISIENDIGQPYLGARRLRKYILNSGYRQVARLASDDIFVKKGERIFD